MNSKKKMVGIAFGRFILGVITISALLFIPAGTVRFWNAWLLMGVLFIPMLFVIVYLFRNPELLKKRIDTNERESTQKKVVLLISAIILSTLVIAGLDYRFGWSAVPLWLVISSSVLVLTGHILFFLVILQNSYASRVVEIQESQKVIDTGLYGIVRHPMYLATILLFIFMPLVLGSIYSLIPLLILPVQLNARMKNEEEVLEKGLDGYTQYKEKVRYKIFPYVW